MTPQQFIGLGVRLFSIWIFINGFQAILTAIGFDQQMNNQSDTLILYLVGGMFLCVAIALWFFPMLVAHKLLPPTQFNNVLSIPVKDTVVVACIILGLWIFTSKVLPSISYYASQVILFNDLGETFSSTKRLHINMLIPLAVNLLVSAILCFKAHSIAKYLTTKPNPPEEDLEEK